MKNRNSGKEELMRQDELKAKRLRIEQFIADCSARFITSNASTLDLRIKESLVELLDISKVDRCILGEIDTEKNQVVIRQEALKPGVKSSNQTFSQIPFDELKWGLNHLKISGTLVLNSKSAIPKQVNLNEKEIGFYGLKNVLVVALKHEDHLIGLMGLVSVYNEVEWSDEEILLYKILGQIYANTLIRVRVENQTFESEKKFKTLAETTTSGIFIETKQNFVYVNPSAEKLTEYSINELIGMSIWDIIHPDSHVIVKENVAKRYAGLSAMDNYEIKIITKSNQVRWIDMSVGLITFNNQPSVLGTVFDITERKLAEEALRASEEEYKELFENANDVIYTHDLDGNFTSLNIAGQNILGYSKEEILGLKITDVVLPEKAELVNKLIQKKNNDTTPTILEIEIVSKEKKIILLELNIRAVYADDVLVGVQGIGRDVTERRKSDRELAEWKRRYDFILESSNHLVYEYNYTKKKMVWGGNLEKVLSYREGDEININRNRVALIHPDDRDMVADVFHATKANLINHNLSYRFKKRNGQYVWLLDVGFTRIDPSTGDIILSGVLQDITSNKRSEEALRLSESRYRMLFERNLSGVFRSTLDGQLLDCNDAFVKMFGYQSKEEFKKDNANSSYTANQPRQLFIEELLEKKSLFSYEMKLQRKDGSIIWTVENVSLIENEAGGEPLIEGTAIDITERKIASDELAQEKEQLSVTLASIADGVITINTDGEIVLINKSAEKILGLQRGEANGKLLDDFYVLYEKNLETRVASAAKKILQDSSSIISNHYVILKNKLTTEKIIEEYATPLFDKTSKLLGSVLVFRDISEKTKTEEELLKAKKIESIGILAGGIAHDFNNILTAILGNISMAKLKLKSEAIEKIENRLSDAEKATLRAKELTQQLLTFSKGGAPIKKSMSLVDILKDNAEFVLSGSNIKLELNIDPQLWHAEVDEGQISQVINNLVINAKQAMPNGGVIQVIAENMALDKPFESGIPLPTGKYILIDVADQGSGIPAEALTKIFDPYFTTKKTGSGLGLATTYSIIKQHKGHITVNSTIGVGTEFLIFLPSSEHHTEQKIDYEPTLLRGAGRILIMDDEPMILKLVADLLEHVGFSVTTVEDGHQAVEKYKESVANELPFDAIIVDLTIPGGMGGAETFEELKKINPKVKVLVSSGYSNDQIMSDYPSYGFAGVVTKPYKLDDLTKELLRVLHS